MGKEASCRGELVYIYNYQYTTKEDYQILEGWGESVVKRLSCFPRLLSPIEGSIIGLLFNVLEGLPSNIPLNLPSSECMALGEHVFDLLERPTGSFRETEKHVNERGKVEGSKDEVSLPRDVGQTRGNGPSQGKVKHPDGGLRREIGDRTE